MISEKDFNPPRFYIPHEEMSQRRQKAIRLRHYRNYYVNTLAHKRLAKGVRYYEMLIKKRINFYICTYPPHLNLEEEFREFLFSHDSRYHVVTKETADACFGISTELKGFSFRHIFGPHTLFILSKNHKQFYSIHTDPVWKELGYDIAFTPLLVCYKRKIYTIPSWEKYKRQQIVNERRLRTEPKEDPELFRNIVLSHNANFNSTIINFFQPTSFIFHLKTCLASWTVLNFTKQCQLPINTQKE